MPNQTRRPAWAFVFAAMVVALCVLGFAALLVLANEPTLPFVLFFVAMAALVKWGY